MSFDNLMIIFLILIVLVFPLYAQDPDSLWMEPFSGRDQGQIHALRQVSDGGYIMIGTIQGSLDSNVYAVRFDSVGHKLWFLRWEGSSYHAGDIRQTRDGGFILATSQHPYMEQRYSAALLRLNNNGQILWSQNYPAAGSLGIPAIIECTDGGFAYCGWTADNDNPWNVNLVRTDSLGQMLWSRTFGGTGDDCGAGLVQTSDGGFVVCGWTTSFGSADVSSFLLRTDSAGKAVWWRTLAEDCRFNNVEAVPGGFIVAGEHQSDSWTTHVVLTKTDTAGVPQWSRTYQTRNENLNRTMLRVLDEGYKIAAFDISLSGHRRAMFVVRADRDGELLWNNIYGDYGVDLTDRKWRNMWKPAAGSFARGIQDFFGQTAPPVAIMTISPSAPLPYRDPVKWYQRLWKPYYFSAWASISYSLPRASRVSISICDPQGRDVLPVFNGYCDEGRHLAMANGSSLPSGIYFLRLACDDAVILKKILILK